MKKFIIKFALFLLGIFLIQSGISRAFPYLIPNDIAEYKTKLSTQPDVLLFGDSATTFINPSDTNRQNLGDMLAQTLQGYKTITIAYPASAPVIYEAIGRFVVKSSPRPKVLVVAVNPRVFSPEWDKRPVFQFEYAKLSLRYWNTPVYPFLKLLIALKAFDVNPISLAQFDATPVYSGDSIMGKVIDFESIKYLAFSDTNMKKIITYFYMMNVGEDHRQLRALVSLGKLFRNSDTKLLFYLTPIDYQTGETYAGTAFSDQLSKNISLVKESLREVGYEATDLTFSLDSSYFGWKGSETLYVNEHLSDRGRLWVAQKLAREVSILLLSSATTPGTQ